MSNNVFATLPNVSFREMNFLNHEIIGLTDNQLRNFMMNYSTRRKTEQDLLMFSILGLCLVPGLQRFITGQVGMGLLYLFTVGLCFIGSIDDLINYKKNAFEYCEKVGFECYDMAKLIA
jgi:TM2 domain-containing membrane protein YozV